MRVFGNLIAERSFDVAQADSDAELEIDPPQHVRVHLRDVKIAEIYPLTCRGTEQSVCAFARDILTFSPALPLCVSVVKSSFTVNPSPFRTIRNFADLIPAE